VINFKVTKHPFWRFAENRYCALNISPIFIKFSPNVHKCMQNMVNSQTSEETLGIAYNKKSKKKLRKNA
jgi:hypothetical protein